LFNVIVDSKFTKVIRNVELLDDDSIRYESYMFLWLGPVGVFRLIYNNFGNCTAWKLNRDTGIWGCFADQHDIGFDRKEDSAPKKKSDAKKNGITLQEELGPAGVEDGIAETYFKTMRNHIERLFIDR